MAGGNGRTSEAHRSMSDNSSSLLVEDRSASDRGVSLYVIPLRPREVELSLLLIQCAVEYERRVDER